MPSIVGKLISNPENIRTSISHLLVCLCDDNLQIQSKYITMVTPHAFAKDIIL